MQNDKLQKTPVVRDRDSTASMDCPYGRVQRIVTGGEGGVANVHVVRITKGLPHAHAAYDEVYYFLGGNGTLTLDGRASRLQPGSVVVIPAGVSHALDADPGQELEFVIFGTPPMSIDDQRARPMRVDG